MLQMFYYIKEYDLDDVKLILRCIKSNNKNDGIIDFIKNYLECCVIIYKNYSSHIWVREVLPLKRLSKEVLKAILTYNVLKYEGPCSR